MDPYALLLVATTRLVAVVTAHKPDAQFRARFAAALRVCERVIAVDKTRWCIASRRRPANGWRSCRTARTRA
jgi:hypothetical protein